MPFDTSNQPEPIRKRESSDDEDGNPDFEPSSGAGDDRTARDDGGRNQKGRKSSGSTYAGGDPIENHLTIPSLDSEQWSALRAKILEQRKKLSSSDVFGDLIRGGKVYRWGVAVAKDRACDQDWQCLSRLACDLPLPRKKSRTLDLVSTARNTIEILDNGQFRPFDCARAVVWAAAMPNLINEVDDDLWWRLLNSLQAFRSGASLRNSASPEYLIGCGELGLTLAWRLSPLPSCRRLQKSSLDSITRWFDNEEDSIAQAIGSVSHTRLVLGCVCRYRMLAGATSRRKLKRQQKRVSADLATWAISQTRRDGTSVFSRLSGSDIQEDLGKSGLLTVAASLDPESLPGAVDGALGRSKKKGRLKWEVSLPESMHHNEDANLACLLPAWDVGRARTFVDYSGEQTRVEVHAGKTVLMSGAIETMIRVDGQEQEPCGEWVANCEYTDDDVHFLELEQPWTGGIVVQRQFLVIRDDRCLLLADCVIPSLGPNSVSTRDDYRVGHQTQVVTESHETGLGKIDHMVRFPTTGNLSIAGEKETREIILSDRRARAMAVPIAAAEWRVGPSDATLRASADNHLVLSATGCDRLYSPLWLDFQRKRFGRMRTWRQLTVADQLRLCERNEAVGYRIQVGSEQWMLYRSLKGRRARTVLGKHFIADFYCARFESGDGSMEDLVTVDDQAEI